jgi:DNA (cytosine-5)-methyltransferase 1
MTHAGFFEGIGGFSLGAKQAKIKTVYWCEVNEFCQKWLKHFLPKSTNEKDITTATGIYADIYTAGFPCQDISVANPNGKGLEGPRSSLFWNFFDTVCTHRPRYVVLENSPNLTNKGLDDILAAFAKIGYNAEWQIISKKNFGHNDLRKRVIVVAYTDLLRRHHNREVFDPIHFEVCQQKIKNKIRLSIEIERIIDLFTLRKANAYAVSTDAGIPQELAKDEIIAYGNAICPNVAQLVFELIKIHNQ